ncbi:MAG: type II toxin-antitoxin system PemK/MazF family toxin [Bryobacteraceae bacterium]|nr:type II toxin-antitoxin system PemK/MazF family toxin [Bryobacteraceae bacterium]
MKPGDVVVGAFPGAGTTKIRPAVVLSTELYHRHRPDVIVGLITTQSPKELAPTDCELRHWLQAGLHQPSFFRLFPVTLLQREVRLIGRLSEFDWSSVRACLKAGFGID